MLWSPHIGMQGMLWSVGHYWHRSEVVYTCTCSSDILSPDWGKCVLISGTSSGRETREKSSKERGTIAAQGRGKERKRGEFLRGREKEWANWFVWGERANWFLCVREGKWEQGGMCSLHFREKNSIVENVKRQGSNERKRTKRESKRQSPALKYLPKKTWELLLIF